MKKKNPKVNLTFDKSAKQFILNTFNANVNAEGYILTNKGHYFPSIDNKPVSFDEFSGIIKHNNIDVTIRHHPHPGPRKSGTKKYQ